MISHLLNIDETLATTVADKLGIKTMPAPADAAVPTRDDPQSVDGAQHHQQRPGQLQEPQDRQLVNDGIDSGLLQAIRDAAQAEGAKVEIGARRVGDVEARDGSWIEANHMIDGRPSVLFDALVPLVSEEAAEMLSKEAAANDFVSDAFAHLKFIGFLADAGPLLATAGLAADAGEGRIELTHGGSARSFVEACRKLRLWAREGAVKL